MNWIKSLLGFGRKELTLVERHAVASQIGQDAIATFDGIVADLRQSAADLRQVAQEAIAEAAELSNRAASAQGEATKHEARATKIAGLLD